MWRRRLSALLPRSPCSSSAHSPYQQQHRPLLIPASNEKPLALNLLRLFTSLSGSDGVRPFIAFILGGPGSGKGTQCSRIASEFGFAHVSAGDLLRNEISSGTDKGEYILDIIKEGRIVPSEITVELVRKAIESSTAKRVLIDGFPRCEENRIAFEKITGTEPDLVVFFDCPEDLMVKRLLGRNQGRVDDNIETIKKRLKVFESMNMPVVDYYSSRGKAHKESAKDFYLEFARLAARSAIRIGIPVLVLEIGIYHFRMINATGSADEIFEAVRKLFSSLRL